jgi:hypothetical protein
MAIHTSAITYRRGIPNNYSSFYFVAQANNVIPSPISSYIRGYNFYDRNVLPQSNYTWPWRI